MSLWPNNTKISFIVLTGDFGSGKSSWALNLAPVPKGTGNATTLVFDNENSTEAYEETYEFKRVDLPRATKQKYGDNWNLGQLYQLWKDQAEELTKDYPYQVLVIDDFSPLQDGAIMIAKGADTMQKWAWVKNDFEQCFRRLNTRVETIVVIVHLRNKRDNSKEKEAKGIDTLKKLATLQLYLHRDPNRMIKIKGIEMQSCPQYPLPSGIILKSRLEWISNEKDDYGDLKRYPLLPDRIPVCTPGALRHYLAEPRVRFLDNEQLPEEIPGLTESASEDEKLETQRQIEELRQQQATNEGRNRLIQTLIEGGYYSSEANVLQTAKELGIHYELSQHTELFNQLVNHSEQK